MPVKVFPAPTFRKVVKAIKSRKPVLAKHPRAWGGFKRSISAAPMAPMVPNSPVALNPAIRTVSPEPELHDTPVTFESAEDWLEPDDSYIDQPMPDDYDEGYPGEIDSLETFANVLENNLTNMAKEDALAASAQYLWDALNAGTPGAKGTYNNLARAAKQGDKQAVIIVAFIKKWAEATQARVEGMGFSLKPPKKLRKAIKKAATPPKAVRKAIKKYSPLVQSIAKVVPISAPIAQGLELINQAKALNKDAMAKVNGIKKLAAAGDPKGKAALSTLKTAQNLQNQAAAEAAAKLGKKEGILTRIFRALFGR